LDADRFAYVRYSSAAPATTRPTIVRRGVLTQNHEWEGLKDEIRRLGEVPDGTLYIEPATEHEQNLKRVIDQCRKAEVRYLVWPPTGHILDELIRECRAGRSAATAPRSLR